MITKYKSIGVIETPFKLKSGMPIQPYYGNGTKGKIVLKKKYVEGLKDLEGFSHIYLIYHLHKSKGFELQVTPFLDNKKHGVFATRAPKRPNPIGLSVVKLLNISKNVLAIENVDILDGTPLLDIKPYISKFDSYDTEKNGWIDSVTEKMDDIKSDDRFN